MDENQVWIILAAVLGSLVLALVVVLSLYCWRRSTRRMRGFSLRSVTPLPDAEFESWRRPSQYTQRPQKYGIRPALPPPVRTTMLEKEIDDYHHPRTPSPRDSFNYPMSPVRKPERIRRKSSATSSIADRPPTPYSPSSRKSEFPRDSFSSRKSYGSPRIHYPSMSEASAFNFDLKDMGFDSYKFDAARPSINSERPLNLSYEKQSPFDHV